jgi:hypothetical protein
MKIVKICFLIVNFSFLFIGCASFPKADNKHDTMVIGAIIQQGKGYDNYYGLVSVNGTKKIGIEISLQGSDKKVYKMKTRTDGLFYSVNIPEGVYKLKKLYLKNESGSAWVSISWITPDDTEHKVKIISGKVNNLGTINWECEKDVKNRIFYNREYVQVRDVFQEIYKSSNWNEKEWIDTKIIKENI